MDYGRSLVEMMPERLLALSGCGAAGRFQVDEKPPRGRSMLGAKVPSPVPMQIPAPILRPDSGGQAGVPADLGALQQPRDETASPGRTSSRSSSGLSGSWSVAVECHFAGARTDRWAWSPSYS